MLVAFFLQFNVSTVYIPWPCTVVEKDEDDEAIILNDKFSKVDPLGFGFLILFGICLILQFTSMLVHRFRTCLHILSTTKLTKARLDLDDPEGMVELVQKMGALHESKPDYDDGDDDNDDDDDGTSLMKKTYRANFMEKTVRLKPENRKQTIKQAFLSRLDQLETMNNQYGDEDFVRNVSRIEELGLGREPKTTAALMTLRNKMMTVRQAKLPDASVFSQRNNDARNGSQGPQKARMYTPHGGIARNVRKPSVAQFNQYTDNIQPNRHGFNY